MTAGTRLKNLEKKNRSPFIQPDFAAMSMEELDEFIRAMTKDLLQMRLNREPAEEEVNQEIAEGRKYMASLSLNELKDLCDGVRR